MPDILGINTLFAELVTGLGLALLVGNFLAWRKHRKGDRPRGVEGEFRKGRVLFLLAIGLLMTVWGVASMLTGNPDSTTSAIVGQVELGLLLFRIRNSV